MRSNAPLVYCVAWPGSSEFEVGAKIFFDELLVGTGVEAECSILVVIVDAGTERGAGRESITGRQEKDVMLCSRSVVRLSIGIKCPIASIDVR